jgi:PAS domain S-box-containing protein
VKTPLHVLMVEDSEDDALLTLRELGRHGYAVTLERVETADGLRAALARPGWEIVLSDYALPGFNGEEALRMVRASGQDLPFIFVSGTIGEDVAVAAMKAGAHDYVMKHNLARLAPAIARELRDALERRQRRAAEAQMRLSEHKYRHLFQTMRDAALLVAEADGRIIDANEQASLLFGLSRDELLGQPVAPLFPPVAASTPGAAWPGSDAAEAEVRRPDGTSVPVHVTVSGITLDQRSFRLALFRDITIRKRAEEALHSSEERLSTVFHLSPTPICIVRCADDRIVDANEAFCAGTGYGLQELVGRTPEELQLWIDPAERAEIIRQMRQKGTAVACLLHGRRKSGEIGVGLGSLTRIKLNGEDHFLWLILDITERERAEEARHESEHRFRQVTENIHEVFWLTDAHRREMVYISPAFESVFGRTCESLYARPQSWFDAIHPDDLERIQSAALTLPHSEGYNLEYRIVRPDDTVRWIHDRAFPIRDAVGAIYRIAGVTADITAQHQLEEQLRQAQKMESLGTLAGGIAHDFNNILTGVLGSAEVARLELPDDHRAVPWLANITRAGNRARDLIQQIMTFGRKHESDMVPRRLQGVVTEALDLLRSTIPAMVQIESRLDPNCPPVIADDTQIHQVVMNLCTNAWHALPEQGGRLEVNLELVQVTPEQAATRLGLVAGPYALITVRDNGRGMPPEILARIFEPFFTTKRKGQGTGLGLAVVHGIVQGHRGAIFCDSTPGVGTRFEVFLPALVSPASHDVSAGEQAYERGRGEGLLLVDDDATALSGLSTQLEHLGYRVTALPDPRTALTRFLASPDEFSIVLTDYAMAESSGLDLAARVLEARPGFPVILVSGLIDSQQVKRARDLGLREVLRKPVPLAELAQVLARHVRPAAHS